MIDTMDKTLQAEQKKYKYGLVIGKFMPLHTGHEALINFASQCCEVLTVAVCSLPEEPIPGHLRYKWTREAFADRPEIVVDHITENLPWSSESSRTISKIRSDYLKKKYPYVDLIISSEPYGEYVAEYMGIDHQMFDVARSQVSVSGTQIRNNPFLYRDFIPAHVKWYFVKKICIVWTESTGKSTLTRLLAEYFNTTYVEEMARYLVSKTQEVVFHDLQDIARLHAKSIIQRTKIANKLLFVDTDLNITRSYAKYLFNKDLSVETWVEEANQFDFYLFLEPNCSYVQDGTRLEETERNYLSDNHKKQLQKAGIQFETIQGSDRDDRYQQAIQKVLVRFSMFDIPWTFFSESSYCKKYKKLLKSNNKSVYSRRTRGKIAQEIA